MSQEFLKRLRDYLNERLKNEPYSEPFRIEPPFSGDRWMICPEFPAPPIASIIESIDGIVSIHSFGTDKAGDYIGECLVRSYQRRFKKAEIKGKEEEEKVWKALRKEEEKARQDYVNRRNFEKRLKKSYKEAFIRLLWFDEVARKISKEYGVKVKLGVNEINCDSGLISEFNRSNMSEEEKFEEIKKRVEAVIAAYKLAEYAYLPRWPSQCEKENHKKYLEFEKAILNTLKGANRILEKTP
jgi:hypothetical protein